MKATTNINEFFNGMESKEVIKSAIRKINAIVAERILIGFPTLVDELITEVANARNLDAEELSDYYYGIETL